jgi:hypothetical protein
LTDRIDVQLLARGELSIEFQRKEGERRRREFKRRGVHMQVHAFPLDHLAQEE